jgi:hypothetical protein
MIKAAKLTAFGNTCEKSDCWTVPMGWDLSVMPWLPHRSCGLLEALARSRRLRRRTALLTQVTCIEAKIDQEIKSLPRVTT